MKKITFKKLLKIIWVLILLSVIWVIGNLFRQWENPFLIWKYYFFEWQDFYQVDEDLKTKHSWKDFSEASNGMHEHIRVLEESRANYSSKSQEQVLKSHSNDLFYCIDEARKDCTFKNVGKSESKHFGIKIPREEAKEYFWTKENIEGLKKLFTEYIDYLNKMSTFEHISSCDSENRECILRRVFLWYPWGGWNSHIYTYFLYIDSEEETYELYKEMITKQLYYLSLTNWEYLSYSSMENVLSLYENHIYFWSSDEYKEKYKELFESFKFDIQWIFADTVKANNETINHQLNRSEGFFEKDLSIYRNIFHRASNDASRDLIKNWECSENIYKKYSGSTKVTWFIDHYVCLIHEWLIEVLTNMENQRKDIVEMLSK